MTADEEQEKEAEDRSENGKRARLGRKGKLKERLRWAEQSGEGVA
jgi:hypothetical protein